MGPRPVGVLVSDSAALGQRPVLSTREILEVVGLLGKSIMLVQWIVPAIRYLSRLYPADPEPQDAQAKPRLVRTSLFGGSTLGIRLS